jgi:glycosyltransferase involved in cell wall biosynthesis
MASMVEEELAHAEYGAILVDHWLMAQYLPQSFGGVRLLHEHNAEYVIWERQAARSRNPLVRREAARVRKYEGEIAERFDRVFCVSESDKTSLVELGVPPRALGVLPNIPDPRLLDLPTLEFGGAPPSIVYIGTLSWQPNIDGLERFLTSVFPLIRDRVPEARFLLAGRGAPKNLEALARKTRGVEFLGAIDDPESLYRRGRVIVEATTSGGGTKLKILNAMARGLPVVASPEAAEGLDCTDGEHLLIARSDVLMAESVLRVLTDDELWQRLSAAGLALVREKYVAEVAFRPLDEALSGAPAHR